MKHIVVVGAGQAGSSLVFKLRALGYPGLITLIGEEADLPYQRPPLSKAYLLGEMARERLYLRHRSSYDDSRIMVRSGQPVVAVDPAEQTVSLAGETLRYDELALTTGSIPIRLPAAIGGDLAGVYLVRTLADIDAMAPELTETRRVLIVGGGYIGLEAAAVAAKKGLDVTVVEMAERILQRVASSATSDFFRKLHTDHGVRIIEGTGLANLMGDGRVSEAILTDGRRLEADFVIVGVGIRPNTTLAERAGLVIDDGIWTDALGRTSATNIWAAGDCASFPYKDIRLRLEGVSNAIDHAEIVAANIMGAEIPYVANPWFWSDQYDVKLQIAGLNSGYNTVVRRSGDRSGSQSLWYFHDGSLLAVDAMNAPRDYMVGKKLIEADASPTQGQVSDPAFVLKTLLKAL